MLNQPKIRNYAAAEHQSVENPEPKNILGSVSASESILIFDGKSEQLVRSSAPSDPRMEFKQENQINTMRSNLISSKYLKENIT